MMNILNKDTYIQFQWEASLEGDPGGVATFTSPHEAVTVNMDDFKQATKLHTMIQNAVCQSRMDALDGAVNEIHTLFKKIKYERLFHD